MANLTTVVPPTILFTGKQIFPSSGLTKLVTNLSPGNNIRQINATTFRQENILMFAKGVLITMTSIYHLKDYSDYKVGGKEFIGEFLDPANINLAEIRYSVNGKEPSFSKNYIYRKPFVLNDNVTGGDNTVLKAVVYRQGVKSLVVEIPFRLI